MLNTSSLRLLRSKGAFDNNNQFYNDLYLSGNATICHVWRVGLSFMALCLVGAILCVSCHASEVVNVVRLANAIYKAEGGTKTKHPYGILTKYRKTTPRQACINTINHRLRDWVKTGSKGDFIVYLSKTYCPIGALNDPKGLNKNWVSNVRMFYNA